jgi:hypothetical protein
MDEQPPSPAADPSLSSKELLLKAEQDVIRIFSRDREETLAAILHKFNELIQAEVSALFLVPEDSPGELEYV